MSEEKSKKEIIIDLCRKKPENLLVFMDIVKLEKGEKEKTGNFGWTMFDVQWLNPYLLGQLKQQGIIKATYESRKRKDFGLAEGVKVEDIEEAIKEVEKEQRVIETGIEGLEDTKVEIPDDLFSFIYNHEDIKTLFKLCLNADDVTHVMLIGKPASAKSLFLSELARFPGSAYVLGGTSPTKVGIRDLIASGVKFLILDEADKIDNSNDLSALLEWAESGRISIVKHKQYCLMQHKGYIFAAANRKDKFSPELLSRFVVINIPEYTEDELRGVIIKVLTDREKKTEEEAEIIADIVIGYLGSEDPRDAIKIARLSKTKDDIETVARIMKKYQKEI